MKLNKKAFISITVLYTLVLVVIITMFMILNSLRVNHNSIREYINDIDQSVNECLNNREC